MSIMAKRSTFKRFLGFAKPYWLLICGAVFCGVLKFTFALALPASLAYVTDYVFTADLTTQAEAYRSELAANPPEGALAWPPEEIERKTEAFVTRTKMQRLGAALGVLVLLFLARTPMTYLRSYLSAKAGHRTIFDIRKELFHHIQRLSLSYHANQRTGSTISRLINDLNTATGILDQGIVALAMDVIFLVGVVVFLFARDFELALVSLFVMPFYAIVFRYVQPRLRTVATEVQEEMEEMSGEVTEKIGGVQVVQSFVREKTEERNFFTRHKRYYFKVLKRVRLRLILTCVAEFLTAFGPMVVIGYGGYRVIMNEMTLGQLILFYGFLQHLYLPCRRLADYSALLAEKLGAMDRVFEVFDSAPDIADRPGATDLGYPVGHLSFRGVSFAYPAENGKRHDQVLHNIYFDAEPGQSVAIVGRSGAGKSTLVNLVPRFYDATEGAVCIDGHDIRDVTLRSLRRNIGMVLQESILFSGSIRDNILYGRASATEDEMRRAAQMAHVDEFVAELPEGYDTIIGERGLSLSGGQRQRLSIARAFLRDPRILILDEATSSLDSGAEHIIQEALRDLMKGRTTLVIAHRLSTIRDCDFVVVLDHGHVVQVGAHDDLIRRKGAYRTLCDEQFGALQLDELKKHVI